MRTSGHSSLMRAGFNLIELLVVVSILGLLVAILVPAVGRVRTLARRSSTLAVLSTLETGLATYKQQNGGMLPPSFIAKNDPLWTNWGATGDPPVVAGADWRGAQLLVQAMIGYRDDDGQPGDGFRAGPRLPVRGPYVETGKMKTALGSKLDDPTNPGDPPTWSAAPVFVSAFGYPILYYKAVPDPSDPLNKVVFDPQNVDNGGSGPSLMPGFPSGSSVPAAPPNIMNYLTHNGTRALPRTDYVLCTPGPDGRWWSSGNPDWGRDDCTNFPQE